MNAPLRILAIDDDPDDRTLVIRALHQEFPDLEVEQITEAKGFARALEAGGFDLVVTDYQLRWTDGLAILRASKARCPDCPVIMFTATGSEEVAVEAMKAGLDDYVLKAPKHFIRLPAAVRTVLEKTWQLRATKEAEIRYRSLFDGVPVGLYRVTPAGEILDANPTLAQMLGYPDSESLLGINAAGLYVDLQERQRWQALIEVKEVVRNFVVQLRRRDGTIIWVEDNSRAVCNVKGQVLHYEGSLVDITERKQAEEALQKASEKRKELEHIVNHGPAVVFLWRAAEGWPVEVVSDNVRQFGYSPEDFYSGRVLFANIVHPDDLERVAAEVDRYSQEEGEDFVQEYRIITQSGEVCWLDDRTRVRRDAKGVITHYQGIVLDITRSKQAEQEKEKIQAQLLQTQKMESIGTLAGGVAHDFNNLLTSIQGYAQLAMKSLNEDDPVYRDLKEVERASLRAASLTRQLLLFSRRQPMEMIPLNLNKTIENMMGMVRRLIGEDIAITTRFGEEPGTIQADPGTIEQVLMNLMVNARDAMPEGGEIAIGTENVHLDEDACKAILDARPGNFVCLSIADTGIGMDAETIERIFEPFFSTKAPGRGTGLGLSVVYGIIKQHEGWINVSSEPGQGTTFRIYLPAVFIKIDAVEEQPVLLAEFQGSGERILLVEDEGSIRALATRMLGENGYVIFAATSAEEAVELFEREKGKFHLVFSDVVLPAQSGLQLVDQLLARNPELRILLSSGYTDEKSQWSLIRARGFRFLQKPYNLSDLLRTIKEVLAIE